MISMMSEISSFYAIGCLLLILCCLLMTHSMTFYVIPYLLLYIVEITYRYKQSCMYIRPALTAVSIMRTLMSPSYKHPQFFHSSPKLLILCHHPQAYTLWVSHRVLHSLYCLHTIRHSHLSIPIVIGSDPGHTEHNAQALIAFMLKAEWNPSASYSCSLPFFNNTWTSLEVFWNCCLEGQPGYCETTHSCTFVSHQWLAQMVGFLCLCAHSP